MIRWLRFLGAHKAGPDPAADAVEQSQQRLAEAEQLAAEAQPTIAMGKALWRRNHLGEAAAAALQHYGSRP